MPALYSVGGHDFYKYPAFLFKGLERPEVLHKRDRRVWKKPLWAEPRSSALTGPFATYPGTPLAYFLRRAISIEQPWMRKGTPVEPPLDTSVYLSYVVQNPARPATLPWMHT